MVDAAGFALLGPVRLTVGGIEQDLGPPKRRCVLAVLLMRPNRAVPVGTLIDRVWSDRPPRSPNAAAPHITRLRKLLPAGVELRYTDGGYRLDCDLHSVDLHRARQRAEAARAAEVAGEHARAADLLAAATSEWSLEPLAGLDGAWAARSRAALTSEGLELRARRAAANLCLERYADVIDELRPVLADHPCAEGLAVPLMRALAAVGRPAEALDIHARVRTALADQLGADPSPALADLHLEILRTERRTGAAAARTARPEPATTRPDEPPAAASGSPAGAGSPASARPAELPAGVAAFTGREAELAELDRLTAPTPAVLPIVAVSGSPGVGKSALVLHWAHRARDRFPDGQLYLNLRGYDPDLPVHATDALARLLTSLGVADRDIPPGLDERAAGYRSALDGRRALVVLDNAASVEQVRPLLPGTPTCTVLVTSRDSLPGLVIRDGARRLEVDLLPLPAAVALLERLLGPRADGPATAVLAQRGARLPLALRIAADLAAHRPGVELDRLIDVAAGLPPGLDGLAVDGDPRTAVRTVFSWSLRQLPAATGRAFALLGLHPGTELEPYALAALAGTDLQDSRRALDRLAAAHLVRPLGTDRYDMHDLLRTYAAELAGADRPAVDRLLEYFLWTAAAAADLLHPAHARRRQRPVPVPGTPVPPLPDAATASAWLDRERAALVDTAAYAAGHGRPEHAVLLSITLFRYLAAGCYLVDGQAIHRHALDAATAAGDLAGQGHALIGLGSVAMEQGRYEPAAECMRRAAALFEQASEPVGAGRARSNLGVIIDRQGRYAAAADELRAALGLFRRVGDATGQAQALNNLGDVLGRLGEHGLALDSYRDALAVARETGDPGIEAETLSHLGSLEGQLRHPDAVSHLQRALALARRLGDRYNEAQTLDSLAAAELAAGDPEAAATHFTASLNLFRAMGHRDAETWCLNGLGEAALAVGDPALALSHHTAALTRAAEHDILDQQARANRGLAAAHQALGNSARARTHHSAAQALYTTLGTPETAAPANDP